jgi:CDP-4-dehydro-6-deoxyglucose reductase, E1
MSLKLVEKNYDESDIKSMIEVLNSDKFTMGEKVSQFEKKFAEKFNFPYCVMVNSGSSANLLGLSVLSNPKRSNYLKPRSRILVPAICWSTSVYPIIQNNHIPVFMDVNPETLNINAEDIDKYDDIQGIVLVHILGNSTNMNKVSEIVKKRNILTFEDTCESLTSKFDGKYLGGIGDMGAFSFYFSHHMTTIEGGVVVCKTEEDYELLKCLRAHGWDRHQKEKKVYDNINSKFCFINFGYNLRPMEIQANMGLNQLEHIDRRNNHRKENFNNITNSILNHPKNLNILSVCKNTEGCEPQWFAIALFLSDEYKDLLDEYMKYLDENEIENRPIVTGNFTRQPVMSLIDRNTNPEDFPGAEKIHFTGFYIGCPCNYVYEKTKVDNIVNTIFNFDKFNKVIPFFDKPYNIDKSIDYVNEAIKSTWISLGGKYVNACQDKLKEITGCKHVILTLTGTAAIHCMVKCLKYRYPECKKIYIPNNTYIACLNVLLHEFPIEQIESIDLNIDTLNINDVSNLESNAALFVIHNIGGITNIPDIKRKRPDLLIFEDNAEGYLGSYEGKPTGSEGIASTLSFNMNKNFTSGQGGAFCTNDDELFNYISSYTRHGFTGKKFYYKMVGNNYRMSNVSAAILLSQIEQEEEILEKKKKSYQLYKELLFDETRIKIQNTSVNTISSYWNLAIRIVGNSSYKDIDEKLLKHNIETRPVFLPFQEFEHLNELPYNKNSNAIKIYNEYILLPFNVDEKIIKYICKTLKNII